MKLPIKRKKTDAPTPDDARSAEKEEKEEKSSLRQQEFIAPADEVEEVKYFTCACQLL